MAWAPQSGAWILTVMLAVGIPAVLNVSKLPKTRIKMSVLKSSVRYHYICKSLSQSLVHSIQLIRRLLVLRSRLFLKIFPAQCERVRE